MYYIRYQMITYIICKCIFIWSYLLLSIINCTHIAWDPGRTPGAHLTLNEKQSQREVISSPCQHVNYLIYNLIPSGNHFECVKPTATHGQKWSSGRLLYSITFISQIPLCRGNLKAKPKVIKKIIKYRTIR